jgi:uncharacterized RDD family membrane protein YckC
MAISVPTASGVTLGLASRWSRLVGQMIDGSIAGLPMFLAAAISKVGSVASAPLFILGIAWMLFYLFLGDGLHQGQSFAKRWLGIRVVGASGAPCTFGQSFVRNIFTILGPIDWIFIFDERRQRLGDKVAGTVVVIAD